MRAIVVGGGIAGPVTALALQRVGIDALVLERGADTRPEAGSWFTIAPNGLAALAEVDALDAIRPVAVPTRHNVMVGATGRELGVLAIGSPLADGTPALSVKRSLAAHLLAAEAKRRGIEVRRGAAVASVATTGRAATVQLADGEQLTADLVVGADGIRSVVRAAVDPGAPAPRYVGLVNFGGITRGTSIAERLRPEAWHFVFGRRAFFGALPTPAGDVVWFANVRRPAVGRAERDATDAAQWQARLVELARLDDGPLAELIAAGELELAADNTHDLPHVPRWHRGRLVLVGDALHAPSPSSGQGAALAAEDAIVLARCLRDAGEPGAAFAAFEAERRRRVERIVRDGARSSSSKNPGRVGRVVQEAIMRLVFRHAVTERAQAAVFDHRVRLGAAGVSRGAGGA
ncbi:FAD-dependent monooxygenase [Microbacterium sp. NPDC091313]